MTAKLVLSVTLESGQQLSRAIEFDPLQMKREQLQDGLARVHLEMGVAIATEKHGAEEVDRMIIGVER